LPHVLKVIGKSVLFTTGFAWAVCAAVAQSRPKAGEEKEWDEIEGRLDRIERAIDLVAAKSERADFVTRTELTGELEDLKHQVDQEVEARFECQSLSVEALRTMIRQTDSLLERVLGALEKTQENEEDTEPVTTSAV
jgi:hypothetical protein